MAKIFIGKHGTNRTFDGFQRWAYSEVASPFIKGGLVEYIVIQYIRDHAAEIFSRRIEMMTNQAPKTADFEQLFETYYSTQPGGDVFDLQVHWGTTIEIKSTASPGKWRLPLKSRWNLWDRRYLNDEKIFPAQYYLLGKMESSPAMSGGNIIFPDVEFYVRSGRSLDKQYAENKSHKKRMWMTYEEFTKGVTPVAIDGLATKLISVQAEEIGAVMRSSYWEWKSDFSPTNGSTMRVPFKLEHEGDDLPLGYYEQNERTRKWTLTERIEFEWKEVTKMTLRDWEAVGFKYDNSLTPHRFKA